MPRLGTQSVGVFEGKQCFLGQTAVDLVGWLHRTEMDEVLAFLKP